MPTRPASTPDTTSDDATVTEPVTATAPAAEPGQDDVVVSNTPSAPADPRPDTEYVADGPIYINGVLAYNAGDPVTAAAVSKNNLEKFVKKA